MNFNTTELVYLYYFIFNIVKCFIDLCQFFKLTLKAIKGINFKKLLENFEIRLGTNKICIVINITFLKI